MKTMLAKNRVLAGPDSLRTPYPPQNIPSCRVDRPEPLKNQNTSSNPAHISYLDVRRKFPGTTPIIFRRSIKTHCVRKQDFILYYSLMIPSTKEPDTRIKNWIQRWICYLQSILIKPKKWNKRRQPKTTLWQKLLPWQKQNPLIWHGQKKGKFHFRCTKELFGYIWSFFYVCWCPDG